MTTQEANYIVNHYYYYIMKFCGCGSPDTNLTVLENALSLYNGSDDSESWDRQYKWAEDDSNLFIANQLDAWGLIEHGSSVYGSWRTDKGDRLLAALELADGGWDSDDIAGWAVEPTRRGFKSAEEEEATFMKEWL